MPLGHARRRARLRAAASRPPRAGRPAKHGDERVEELRRLDRLGEEGGEVQRRPARASRRPERGEQHQRQRGASRQLRGSRAPASAPSISGICMSRMARSKGSPPRGSTPAPRAATPCACDVHAPRVGLRGEDAAVGRVVVHDQHALAAQRAAGSPRGRRRGDCRRRRRRRDREVEGRALPAPSLSTHIVPPISSLRRLLIASPSPVPPYRRVVEASTWLNDWNSRSIRSGGMPMPVSRTANVQLVRAPAHRSWRARSTRRARPPRRAR